MISNLIPIEYLKKEKENVAKLEQRYLAEFGP